VRVITTKMSDEIFLSEHFEGGDKVNLKYYSNSAIRCPVSRFVEDFLLEITFSSRALNIESKGNDYYKTNISRSLGNERST
jgi:hypothetical protein